MRATATRTRTQQITGTTDRHLDRLLALLADSPMLVLSGERIARETGVTRSTVWRWINKLRGVGVKVRGHERSGYRIERIPDVLVPDLLRRQLRGAEFGKRIHHFFKIDSTNRVALELGFEGEPHGAVIVAEEQTAGRGRAGRAWISERSAGIYMSVLLRPALTPAQAPMLTMAAGLAVRNAIAAIPGAEVDIRWPNDVLIAGRKVCGILTEMQAEPDRIKFVVVGIGINVNQSKMPAGIEKIATSLRMATGKAQSRIEIAVRVLREFEGYYKQLIAEGAAPLVARFGHVSSYAKGKKIRVSTGQESFVAETAGLDAAGLLRVTRENGKTETLLAADISEAD
jgi:BirA family transcriptional regulator, biotin operon repressor / biotin---[acetyl-CoA-carboxylase] ligase